MSAELLAELAQDSAKPTAVKTQVDLHSVGSIVCYHFIISIVTQDAKILQRIFDRIDYKRDNKIDKEELEQTLISLGYEPVKVRAAALVSPQRLWPLITFRGVLQINQYGISEVEQMIWEVDEDSDGCVSLAEFQLMFERARNDRTGHEPRKLFNLCQYMCLDRDGDGSITSEECMEMIMHRFGR